MNSQKLSYAKLLPKRWIQMGLVVLTATLASCAAPTSDPETAPQSANINLTFPYLAKEVKLLEYRLEPNGNTTVKGTDLTRVGQVTVDPTASPKLELTDLTTGSYQITVKAKDATDGIVLYKTTRAVQASPAPKANSSTKQATPQTIVLGRATGVVELTAPAPTDGTTLNYIAQLGANKINLRLENNQLLGRFNAVPTGRNLEVLVEGRDRAGTLLYQGGKRFDLPDSLISQNLELQQVTAERVPPVISSIRVPNQVAPGEKFKLELELKASANPSAATLSDVLVNWGDGISEIPTVTGPTATLTLEHAFTEVNAQVITVTVINSFGLRAQETRDVAVTDPTGVRPESPLSLVYVVVRDVPLNVDSLEAKLSPIAIAGSRTTEPERTVRLTKDTPNIWGGSIQLLKGSSYNTNLTAKIVALSQVLPSSSNGTYTAIAPSKDSETVELQFVAPIILNPGDDPTIARVPTILTLNQVPLTAAELEAEVTKTPKTGEPVIQKYAMTPINAETWILKIPNGLEQNESSYSVKYRMTSEAGVTVVGPQVLTLPAARSSQTRTTYYIYRPDYGFEPAPVITSPTPPPPPIPTPPVNPLVSTSYTSLGQFNGDGGTCDTLQAPGSLGDLTINTVQDFISKIVYSGYQWRIGDGTQLKLFKDYSTNTFYFVIAGSVPTAFEGNINDGNENLFSQSPTTTGFSSYTTMVKQALKDASKYMNGGKLVVTGHSQGGNIASLLYASYLAESDEDWIKALKQNNVTLIGGFGVAHRPIKVLDELNAEQNSNRYVQIFTTNDVVPQMTTELIDNTLPLIPFNFIGTVPEILLKNGLFFTMNKNAYYHDGKALIDSSLRIGKDLGIPQELYDQFGPKGVLVDLNNVKDRAQMYFPDQGIDPETGSIGRSPYLAHGSAYIDKNNRGFSEIHTQPDMIYLLGKPSDKTVYEFKVLQNDWELDSGGSTITASTITVGQGLKILSVRHVTASKSGIPIKETGTLEVSADKTSLIYKPDAKFWRENKNGTLKKYDDIWEYTVYDPSPITNLPLNKLTQTQEVRIKILPSEVESPNPEERIVLYPNYSAPIGDQVFPANAPIQPYLPGANNSGNVLPSKTLNLKHILGWAADCRTHPIIPEGKEKIKFKKPVDPKKPSGEKIEVEINVCLPNSRPDALKYLFAPRLTALGLGIGGGELQDYIEKRPDGVPDTLWVDSSDWGEKKVDNKKPSPGRSILEAEVQKWDTITEDPSSLNPQTFSRNLLSCERGRDPEPPNPDGGSVKKLKFNPPKPPNFGPRIPSTSDIRNFPVKLKDILKKIKDFIFGTKEGRTEIIKKALKKAGFSYGDPHISTIDGITYTTMSLGEFVLARSTVPGGLELQVRHARLPNFADWASFNVAASVRAGGRTLEVRLPPSRAGTEKLILLLDGQPLELPNGVYSFGETTVEIGLDNTLTVYSLEENLPTQFVNSPEAWTVVRIGKKPDNDLVGAATDEPVVSLDISMSTLEIGRYRGLLGTPNGQVEDEMTIPNGTVVTSLKGFVEAWRNTDRTKSLFTYEAGQGPETFNLVQDKAQPTEADLAGANGGRNYIAEITALIRDKCKENPDAVDPTFIQQGALELALGRTPQNLISNGFCYDSRVYKAGLPLPSVTAVDFSGQVLLEGLTTGASGATVTVTSPTLGLKLCETTTNDQGRYSCGYTFERPTNSSNLQLIYRVRGRGATLERDASVPMPAAEAVGLVEQNFTAKVRNVLHLRGRILNPAGVALPNAFVRILSPYREFVADVNGAFDIYEPVPDGITSGSVRLEATNSDASAFIGRDLSFQATQPGVVDLTQDLQLQANVEPPALPIGVSTTRFLTVLGRVVNSLDPDKKAVPNASVSIGGSGSNPNFKSGCNTNTDSLGNYACVLELTTDKPFDTDVRVFTTGSSPSTTINIGADDLPAPGGSSNKTIADIEVKAPRYLKILGRVLDAVDASKGVVQATVTIRAPGSIKDYLGNAGSCTTSTDFSGNYSSYCELISFQPFSAQVEVSGTGTAAPVTINIGASDLPVPGGTSEKTIANIQAQATVLQITGIVRGQGNVIAGADVTVTLYGTNNNKSGKTDASGRYTIRYPVKDTTLPTEKLYFRAEFTTPAGTSRANIIDVDVGTITPGTVNQRTQDIEFVTRKLNFTGLVKNAFAIGQPVSFGALVRIYRDGNQLCPAYTNSYGTDIGRYNCPYEASGSAPFEITYEIQDDTSLPPLLRQTFTVDPSTAPVNGTTPIPRDFEINASTLHLSGTITKTGGAVVPNAKLEVIGNLGANGLRANFETDAQGRYSVYFDFDRFRDINGSPSNQKTFDLDLRATDGTQIVSKKLTVVLNKNVVTEQPNNLEITTSNSGTLKWTYTDPNPDGGLSKDRTPIVGPDGTIYTIQYNRPSSKYQLLALAPDGTQRWTYSDIVESLNSNARLQVGSDGTIYLAAGLYNNAINLYAINPNGTRKYLFQAGDPLKSNPVPGANGIVYAIFGSKLYKISANGSSIWSATVNTTNVGNGGIRELTDGTIVVVTTRGDGSASKGSLVIINADGSVRRSTELEVGFNKVERVEADGTVYAYREDYCGEGGDCTDFTVFNPNGIVRWSRTVAPLIATNGVVYFQDSSGVIALDSAGNQLWTAAFARGTVDLALSPDGTVIVTTPVSSESSFYYVIPARVTALAPTDGSIKWTYAFSSTPTSLKIGLNSTIYVNLTTGSNPNTVNRIVALNPDGSSKWQFTNPDNNFELSTILEVGNVVYFNTSLKLFALNR